MARSHLKVLVAGGAAVGVVALARIVRQKRRERWSGEARALVGEVCRVTSRKMTRRGGEMAFHDGNGSVKLKGHVVDASKLSRGDMVRIVGLDPVKRRYTVEPITFD